MIPDEYTGSYVLAIYQSPEGMYSIHAHQPEDAIKGKEVAHTLGFKRVRVFEAVNEDFRKLVDKHIQKHQDHEFEISDLFSE